MQKTTNLSPEVKKALRKNVVGKKPFNLKNKKQWFGGQEVHVVGINYKGLKEFPSELVSTAAAHCISILDRVWLDKGEVAEGIVSDLYGGLIHDPNIHAIASGLKIRDAAIQIIADCRSREYIIFSDGDGNTGLQAWEKLPFSKVWFRIGPKLEKLIISDPV